jgi:thioredoxin reductase
VELRSGEVLGGERHDAGFVLELGDGSREAARVLATGMDYRFPALPGIAERWGRSVSTARSAMAGRSAMCRSEYSTGVPRVCSGRSCCASGATT